MAIPAYTYTEKPKAIEYERPFLLTLISIMLGFGGLHMISAGVYTIAIGIAGISSLQGFPYVQTLLSMAFIIGPILIFVGLFIFFVGYGLWHLRRWAWILTVILLTLGIIGGVATAILMLFSPVNSFVWASIVVSVYTLIMGIVFLIYMISIRHLFK